MNKSNSNFEYIGNELELFKSAINWKVYFSGKLNKYIKGDVLEVGAGIGTNTKYLLPETHTISSWCFLEPDRMHIKEIENNTREIKLPIKQIINGKINQLRDQTFDVILYIDVLEHIEDSKDEIDRAIKLLNNNGILIIIVPAYNLLYSKFDANIGHFRRYNKSMMKNEFKNPKNIVGLFYLDSMGLFASVFNKYFLKKELPTKSNIKFWDKYLIPLSKLFDAFIFNKFGKSLICIYKK